MSIFFHTEISTAEPGDELFDIHYGTDLSEVGYVCLSQTTIGVPDASKVVEAITGHWPTNKMAVLVRRVGAYLEIAWSYDSCTFGIAKYEKAHTTCDYCGKPSIDDFCNAECVAKYSS